MLPPSGRNTAHTGESGCHGAVWSKRWKHGGQDILGTQAVGRRDDQAAPRPGTGRLKPTPPCRIRLQAHAHYPTLPPQALGSRPRKLCLCTACRFMVTAPYGHQERKSTMSAHFAEVVSQVRGRGDAGTGAGRGLRDGAEGPLPGDAFHRLGAPNPQGASPPCVRAVVSCAGDATLVRRLPTAQDCRVERCRRSLGRPHRAFSTRVLGGRGRGLDGVGGHDVTGHGTATECNVPVPACGNGVLKRAHRWSLSHC